MKKLVFIGIIFLLSGCNNPTFKEDPSIKESERIAVLEKAKTDTLSIIIKIDDNLYIVEKGVIKGRTFEEQADHFGVFMVGLGLGLFISLIIYSTSRD